MKLTKAIREEITAKALTATFSKRDDAHAKSRKAFSTIFLRAAMIACAC